MKHMIAIALSAGLAASASAQVSTNCTTIGNQTNCTTVDGPQRYHALENAHNITQGAGQIAVPLLIRHRINKLRDQQCDINGPGSTWIVQSTTGLQWQGVCTAKQAGVK
jgi:hypothetical protein